MDQARAYHNDLLDLYHKQAAAQDAVVRRVAAAAVHGTSRVVEDPYLFLYWLRLTGVDVVRGEDLRLNNGKFELIECSPS